MKVPSHLLYTEDHEWFDPNTGKLGITDFAQDQLGDVVYLDFAVSKDAQVGLRDVLGTVESVKTVADIYAPLGGKIVEINQAILDSPEAVNKDPYDKGWMFRIEIPDQNALNALMDAKKYRALIGVEGDA